MGASITIAGERLIAQKQADRQPLEVARFVLAYLPGLDTTQPVDRDAGLPPAEQIVYSVNISRDGSAGPNGELTREGYLSPNQVVYSLLMGTNIGDFDFNWIGLQTTEDVLLISAYVPRQQKRRELPPLQTGNNLTRNIVLEYDGAQSLTGIEVPAASWQFDFTAQFAAMNTQIAALQAELEKKVDAASWNPPQSVSLDGPVLVYPGSSNTYQITDFDAFAVYQASSTVGSVTLLKDALTLEIPAEAPEGLVAIEVRRDAAKATFKVPVGSAAIDQPAILSPSTGATNVTFEPDLAASAFVVYPAGYESHAETHWQVARDLAFTDLVFDQQGAANLTAVNLAAAGVRLDPATRYYARAKYIGTTLVSEWSAAVAFNTATIYIRKPTITSPLDGAEGVSSSLTAVADAFSVSGGADTHQSSRWQFSTVADFSTVIVDSGWSVTQLTSYKPAGLTMETAYFVRVKYRGAQVGESEWSPVVAFTTADRLQGLFTSLNGGASARSNHGMAELDGKLYVYGGTAQYVGYLDDFWRYDPESNSWQQLTSLFPARAYVSLVGHGGYIYAFGGSASGTYNYMHRYDPVLNKWSVLATGPSARYGATAAAYDGKIYIFGGNTAGSSTGITELWCYDIAANTWTQKQGVAPGRYASSGGFIGGELYIGLGASSGSCPYVDKYNPVTNTWARVSTTTLPTRLWESGAVVAGKLYFFGGDVYEGAGATTRGDLVEFDPVANKWELIVRNGSYARAQHRVAAIGNKIYCFGGLLGSTQFNTLFSVS